MGNLTDDGETYEYVYDAFGRLVQIKNQSSDLVSQHRYNGLGYRIAWQYDLDADGTVETTGSNHDPWLYQVHDTSWRVVATVFAVDDGAGTEAGESLAKADDDPRELFVFDTAKESRSRSPEFILATPRAKCGNAHLADLPPSAARNFRNFPRYVTQRSRKNFLGLRGPFAGRSPLFFSMLFERFRAGF